MENERSEGGNVAGCSHEDRVLPTSAVDTDADIGTSDIIILSYSTILIFCIHFFEAMEVEPVKGAQDEFPYLSDVDITSDDSGEEYDPRKDKDAREGTRNIIDIPKSTEIIAHCQRYIPVLADSSPESSSEDAELRAGERRTPSTPTVPGGYLCSDSNLKASP